MSSNKPQATEAVFGLASIAARENVDATKPLYGDADETWALAQSLVLRTNWNGLFPYQFIILERVNGKWQQCTRPNVPGPFTLPIPPQSLSIGMTFNSIVEATQGGVIEQHNKSKFRDISLQGTTGVLPLRGTVQRPTGFGLARGIFTGTANAGLNLVNSASTSIRNAVQSPLLPATNVIANTDFASTADDSPGYGTGYYQFLLLKRFLEWYDGAKAQKVNQNLALGFAVWKEAEVYIVTPSAFNVNRNASKPLEYSYSLTLKAWKRVLLKDSAIGSLSNHEFVGRNPNLYAQVMSGIDIARRTLENGRKVLGAVRADVNNVVFGTLRQVSLFVKDAIGTGFALADLPINLISDFKEPLLEKIGATGTGTLPSADEIAASISSTPQELTRDLVLSDYIRELGLLAALSQKNKTNSGTADELLSDFLSQRNAGGASKAMKLFNNPEEFYNFWGSIRYDNLQVRPTTVKKIEDARRQVQNLRREDFERMRDQLQSALDDFTNAVGAGDATYSSTYSLATREALRTEPTTLDWEIMGAMSDAISHLDALAASSSINRTQTLSAVDLVAGLARSSGIAFTTPKSKYLIPFPYGSTLEQLAERYLGSADRWIEIAALNGLRGPYVDEVGFSQELVANGTGSQLAVSDGSNFFVGQPVWVSSIGVQREKRRIVSIQILSATATLLTVDGTADMHRFMVANKAFVQAFIPDTVNSLQYIYIPSDEDTENDWQTKAIPGIDTFDPLYRVGGADLMIDATGDLVVTSDGTTRLAVGLNNLIQRVRIAAATPLGSLMHHPQFGFGVLPGSSTADVSATGVLAAAKAFIDNEEGFAGVEYASVKKDGNVMTITLAVKIAGVNKTVPITVQVR